MLLDFTFHSTPFAASLVRSFKSSHHPDLLSETLISFEMLSNAFWVLNVFPHGWRTKLKVSLIFMQIAEGVTQCLCLDLLHLLLLPVWRWTYVKMPSELSPAEEVTFIYFGRRLWNSQCKERQEIDYLLFFFKPWASLSFPVVALLLMFFGSCSPIDH